MYLAHAGLFYFMPNTKKIAPLVQDTNSATLSHETAKISKLSTEGKEKLIKVLKLFFGDNKADDNYYEGHYWSALMAAMSSNDLEPFERQNCVNITCENIIAIKILYELFIELKLD